MGRLLALIAALVVGAWIAWQEERLPDQRVEVSFGVDEADAGAAGEAGERPAERGPPAQTR